MKLLISHVASKIHDTIKCGVVTRVAAFALPLQLLCTEVYEISKTSRYATQILLDNGISFTNTKLVDPRSFKMNQQQTYMGAFLFYFYFTLKNERYAHIQ